MSKTPSEMFSALVTGLRGQVFSFERAADERGVWSPNREGTASFPNPNPFGQWPWDEDAVAAYNTETQRSVSRAHFVRSCMGIHDEAIQAIYNAANWVVVLFPAIQVREIGSMLYAVGYLESGFNAAAVGDHGKSKGAFQIHDSLWKYVLRIDALQGCTRESWAGGAKIAAYRLSNLMTKYGDWPFAITAYMAGEQGAKDIVEKIGKKGNKLPGVRGRMRLMCACEAYENGLG